MKSCSLVIPQRHMPPDARTVSAYQSTAKSESSEGLQIKEVSMLQKRERVGARGAKGNAICSQASTEILSLNRPIVDL